MIKYKYRIYVERINGGSVYGTYFENEYKKAQANFEGLVSKGYDAVYLQEMNQTYGWVERDIATYVTKSFKKRKDAYWKLRAEADESANWRAGDAPWNAPGMSIRDFF